MSTMFTPMTLLRFSFLPCAATLHAIFLDQHMQMSWKKQARGWLQA